MQYLAHLLRHPGQKVRALDLVQLLGFQEQGAGENRKVETRSRGLDLLDPQAKREYRQRLQELRTQLSEADELNDLGRAAKLRAEIDFLARHLNAAVDLHGKDRKAGADDERARLLVTKRIKSVLKMLDTLHPPLAHHLRACVKTGYYCSYSSPPVAPPVWET
jgi:hypothetical protein